MFWIACAVGLIAFSCLLWAARHWDSRPLGALIVALGASALVVLVMLAWPMRSAAKTPCADPRGCTDDVGKAEGSDQIGAGSDDVEVEDPSQIRCTDPNGCAAPAVIDGGVDLPGVGCGDPKQCGELKNSATVNPSVGCADPNKCGGPR